MFALLEFTIDSKVPIGGSFYEMGSRTFETSFVNLFAKWKCGHLQCVLAISRSVKTSDLFHPPDGADFQRGWLEGCKTPMRGADFH